MNPLLLSTTTGSVRTITYTNESLEEEDVHYITQKDRTIYVLADKGVVILILPDTYDHNATLFIKRLPMSKYPVVIKTNETHMEGSDENTLDDEDNYIIMKFYENYWYLFC